ncbi:MAG: histidine phosphatase family protein [Pseudomonadota bacterium]
MTSRLTGRRRLYLMRHGHVDYFAPRITDFNAVPLTEEGRRQATQTGTALGRIRFDAVFTSGLPRTLQTAQLVLAQSAEDQPAPVEISDFAELRGGNFVVPTREELAARLAFSFDNATDPGATFLPGGEAFADAYERVQDGLSQLIGYHEWSTALLVGHDGVNRLILGLACGAGLAGIGAFEQDLACVNVLDFDVVHGDDGTLSFARIMIKAVNLTAYDPVKEALIKTSLEHLFDIDFGGARPLPQ